MTLTVRHLTKVLNKLTNRVARILARFNLTRCYLNVEMTNLKMESEADRGFERFVEGSIEIDNDILDFDLESLDKHGQKVFKKHVTGSYEVVKCTARLSWTDDDSRVQCIEDQTSRNRWHNVEAFSALINNDQWNYERPGPTFIHPEFTGRTKLRAVDGARRIMAHLESHAEQFPVRVIRRQKNTSKRKKDTNKVVPVLLMHPMSNQR